MIIQKEYLMHLQKWYKIQINDNKLLLDNKQLNVIKKLDLFITIFNKLHTPRKSTLSKILKFIKNIILKCKYSIIFDKKNPQIKNKYNNTSQQGYYIYGSFGGGKTMIMNQLYNSIATHKKLRLHFHKFMDNIQKQLTNLTKNNPSTIEYIAKNFAKNYKIIFLDEMHVNDITNAMILNNLLSNLLKKGIYLIISSNYLPDNLYKDGLMRERFVQQLTL